MISQNCCNITSFGRVRLADRFYPGPAASFSPPLLALSRTPSYLSLLTSRCSCLPSVPFPRFYSHSQWQLCSLSSSSPHCSSRSFCRCSCRSCLAYCWREVRRYSLTDDSRCWRCQNFCPSASCGRTPPTPDQA